MAALRRRLPGTLLISLLFLTGCSDGPATSTPATGAMERWVIQADAIQEARIRPALPLPADEQWVRRAGIPADQEALAKLAEWLSAAEPVRPAPPTGPMHFNELVLSLKNGGAIRIREALNCTVYADAKGYTCGAEPETVEATRSDWPGEWLRSPELYGFLVGRSAP